MTTPIIRTEVQVTPTIDILGNETFAWRVYQITGDYQINLDTGFNLMFVQATVEAYESAKKYMK